MLPQVVRELGGLLSTELVDELAEGVERGLRDVVLPDDAELVEELVDARVGIGVDVDLTDLPLHTDANGDALGARGLHRRSAAAS